MGYRRWVTLSFFVFLDCAGASELCWGRFVLLLEDLDEIIGVIEAAFGSDFLQFHISLHQ